MIVLAADGDELRRWTASAAIVLALHATGAALLVRWYESIAGDEGSAITVDLAPFKYAPTESRQEIAPGPLRQQFEPSPQRAEPEQRLDEKVQPPPPAPEPDVVLSIERVKVPETPKQQSPLPAPETTAPPRPRPSAAQLSSWYRRIATQIERHKRYPAAAQARRETGVAKLAFTIDRAGRVVASRIVESSGSRLLDQETIATVHRAAPFPPPPADLPGETFDFTLPIRFNISQ